MGISKAKDLINGINGIKSKWNKKIKSKVDKSNK